MSNEQHGSTDTPPGTAAAVAVTRPETVTIYDEDGIEHQVRAEDAPRLQAKGYTRERFDMDALGRRTLLLLDSAKQAIVAWVAEVEQDKRVYREDDRCKWIAELAVRDFSLAWLDLHQGIHRAYPHSEGATVTLKAPDGADLMDGTRLLARAGQTFAVDPTQVDLYTSLGAEATDAR